MKRFIITAVAATFICAGTGQVLASDAGIAPAAAVVENPATTDATTPDLDPIDVAGKVVADARSGDWRHAASGLLFLAMLGLGKYRDKVSWFKGDRGGAVLVAVLGLAGGLGTALASDAPLDWRLFIGAVGVVWTAVGGVTWVKQILWPRDKASSSDAENSEDLT